MLPFTMVPLSSLMSRTARRRAKYVGVPVRVSVLVYQRSGDVGGREQGEDVGLQELDQDLEDGQHEGHDIGASAGDLEADTTVDDHVLTAGDEQKQEQVAGKHVAEEPQRQCERARDEEGDDLEKEDDRNDPAGQARRNE